MRYFFKPRAARQLKKLPRDVQRRIIRKLDFYCTQDDPLEFADPLMRSELGSYRFRIGDYRIVFDLSGDGMIVVLVGHRRDIYR